MFIEQAGRHSYVSTLGKKFPFDGTDAARRQAVEDCERFESEATFDDHPGLRGSDDLSGDFTPFLV